MVWKLDRLSRSLKDVLHIMEHIADAGARFGTADFDTACYLFGALGQQTILYKTQNVSQSSVTWSKPGGASSGTGEHLHGRSLLTPDEVMRLSPTRPTVLVSGEPPYLLHRVGYLTDPAYAAADANPLRLPDAA